MIRRAVLAAACLALAATPRPARAQADTTRDTTRARARDTTPPDTIPHFLATFAPAIPAGPLPRGARYTFDTDSLRFSDVVTIADLLGHVPGVYVARGGAYGAPEVAFYGARGALGIEVYWDGVPYLPLGRDSLYHDFARIPIAPLERVDVVVLPATLRVYLTSARQHSTVPTSVVRIQTGEFSVADYRGAFARRWRSGFGIALVADWNSINRDPATSTPEFGSVDLWLKGEYIPDEHFGVSYQVFSSAWDRTAIPEVMARWRSKRQDALLRLFTATRPDGLGFRLDAALLRTSVSRDSAVPDRSGSSALVALSYTWPRAGVSLTTGGGAFRPATMDLQGGWTLAPLTLAADARLAGYVGNRSGKRAHLGAGLALPLGFSLHGDVAWMREVPAPLVGGLEAQQATDLSGAVRWDGRRWTVELGGVRRDPYQPFGFPVGLLGRDSINALGPVPRSRYLQFSASIRPVPGLTLSGWYFDPIRGGGDFEPPRHGRFSATFYSKFWRVYKSGVFALRGEYAVESWSTGLGGLHRDTLGNAVQVPLAGSTWVETNLQIQIVGVTAYWVVRNNNFFRGSYVHGLSYPRRFQYYGVRWVFSN